MEQARRKCAPKRPGGSNRKNRRKDFFLRNNVTVFQIQPDFFAGQDGSDGEHKDMMATFAKDRSEERRSGAHPNAVGRLKANEATTGGNLSRREGGRGAIAGCVENLVFSGIQTCRARPDVGPGVRFELNYIENAHRIVVRDIAVVPVPEGANEPKLSP
jgi:hypothetical protein